VERGPKVKLKSGIKSTFKRNRMNVLHRESIIRDVSEGIEQKGRTSNRNQANARCVGSGMKNHGKGLRKKKDFRLSRGIYCGRKKDLMKKSPGRGNGRESDDPINQTTLLLLKGMGGGRADNKGPWKGENLHVERRKENTVVEHKYGSFSGTAGTKGKMFTVAGQWGQSTGPRFCTPSAEGRKKN